MKRSVAFKRAVAFVMFVVLLVFGALLDASPLQTVAVSGTDNEVIDTAAKVKPFYNIFSYKSSKKVKTDGRKVYAGGMPIGFTVAPEGVIVVGFSDVDTGSGKRCPARECGLLVGDIISAIEGEAVNSAADIDRIINAEANEGRTVAIDALRSKKPRTFSVTPAKDAASQAYRVGVYVKAGASGLGTVTYITQDHSFGALGHPVADGESRVVVPVKEGTCYKCDIMGYSKSSKGRPGALRGFFLKNKNIIGTVEENNTYGIFGWFKRLPVNVLKEPIPVCPRGEVELGAAKIRTTLSSSIDEFDIEIVKAYSQRTAKDKGMVIRVTDLRLIDKTGGIVQGMSGSPIIQNGRLVGAVTHVFVNDPLCGYAVYADFMLEQTDKLPKPTITTPAAA